MSALSDVRAKIKAALDAADLNAYVIIPGTATPPFTYVAPGDPYLTREGATFGGEIVRCNVGVVVGRGINDKAADDLDEALLNTLDALAADPDLVVGETSQPGQVPVNSKAYLGVSVEVLTEIHRS